MPLFTVETTYRLPAFRHRTYRADSVEAACRLAVEDDDWSDESHDVETAGPNYVTGVWRGRDAAYRGTAIPVPDGFDDVAHRKARVFMRLLIILRVPAQPMGISQHDFDRWLPRAQKAIAAADAIIADEESATPR